MNFPEEYRNIFDKLSEYGSIRHGSNQWYAHCPSHEDSKPSLSLRIADDGKLLVACHAPCRCRFADIAKALNVKPSSFYQEKKDMSNDRVAAVYNYRDETGKDILFQVVRWLPKRFTQRRNNLKFNASLPRKDEHGQLVNPEFVSNTDGVRRVLYRLPEMLHALQENPKRWILVMEGEKDVDLAIQNKIAAVTNPMGALHWKKEYVPFFKDVNVAIFPDNDPIDPVQGFSPGRRHALEIADSLVGVANDIRVIDTSFLPDKGDFTDYWTAMQARKKTLEERKLDLASKIRNTPSYKPAAPVQPPVEIIQPVLALNEIETVPEAIPEAVTDVPAAPVERIAAPVKPAEEPKSSPDISVKTETAKLASKEECGKDLADFGIQVNLLHGEGVYRERLNTINQFVLKFATIHSVSMPHTKDPLAWVGAFEMGLDCIRGIYKSCLDGETPYEELKSSVFLWVGSMLANLPVFENKEPK